MKVECTGKNKKQMIQELLLPISFKYRMKRTITGPKSWKESKSNKKLKTSQKKRKTSPPQPCGICFQRIKDKNIPKIKLPCGHNYHDVCIRPWVVGQNQETCPLCRGKIPEKERKIIKNFAPIITRSKARERTEGSDIDSDSEIIQYSAEWWEEQFRTRDEDDVMDEWDRYYGTVQDIGIGENSPPRVDIYDGSLIFQTPEQALRYARENGVTNQQYLQITQQFPNISNEIREFVSRM